MAISAKPLVIFLMGPTASGKTALAMQLAEHLPVDLINVDATQVYRGLNIGAAKPSADELARFPHHLIDIRDPAEVYSAAEFRRDALREISGIHSAGRIPLLVGGSMLYFKILLEGLAKLPPGDPAIRAEIEALARQRGWPYVHGELAKVDPKSAQRLHPNHSQRIARALEIYRVSGKTMTALHGEQQNGEQGGLEARCRVIQLAIAPGERKVLHQRIEQRFTAMVKMGLIDEVQTLRQRPDLNPTLPSMRAAGYRQVWEFLDGKLSYEEMLAQGIAATRQLAKRQLTWLKSWPNLQWIYTDEAQGYGEEGEEAKGNKDQILERALNYIEATTI